MSKNLVPLVKSFYGEDYFESLCKNDVYKPETRTTVDMGEVRTALHLVPKTILLWLVRNLKGMEKGESKELKIPMVPKGVMNVTKMGMDNYTGELIQDNDKKYDFEHRPIPGIGLCIMSTFELYDIEDIKKTKDDDSDVDNEKLTIFVNEKLESDRLVDAVKNKEIDEKDAHAELLKLKLIHKLWHLEEDLEQSENKEDKDKKSSEKRKSKLADFIKNNNKNLVELSFAKSEEASCPSCNSKILSKGEFNGCACFGEDMFSTVKLVKSEDGHHLYKFEKGWDKENKDRLIKILKDKRNRR